MTLLFEKKVKYFKEDLKKKKVIKLLIGRTFPKMKSMKNKAAITLIFSLFLLILIMITTRCQPKKESKPWQGTKRFNEREVPYAPRPWIPRIWKDEPPAGCPFAASREFTAIAFTGKHISYTDADTWYPSWAADGNMYSGWTDGEIGLESCHSSGGEKAKTGNARIEGDDPMNLKIISLGTEGASALPYGGRYPCAYLVYDGVWYYGTYVIDFDPDPKNKIYSWAICGPFVGFRISKDYGQSWIPCPLTPNNPLFPESGKNGRRVKMGTPHFVDFGRNMENSPDGKAYLVGHGAIDNDPTPRVAGVSWIAGDAIYLARVKPSPETINNLSCYEFFSGFDEKGEPIWSKRFSDLKPLLVWNDHMGCVTITYNKLLKKYLMCVTDGWPGIAEMNTYILESDKITGPYRMITYMKNFGIQGYFVTFPSKFIRDDGKTLWLSYSANFHEGYFADRTKADPLGSRYAWNLQEVRLLTEDEERQLRHEIAQAQPDPIKSEANLALRAEVIVSSSVRKARQLTEVVQFFGEGAVDGVVDLENKNKLYEWVSEEKDSAFIRLLWKKPVKISKIWLFDRPDPENQITSGMLVFSDGSTIPVNELPNDARLAKEINFPAKNVTWLAFIITGVSPSTKNAGLAEIAVFDR